MVCKQRGGVSAHSPTWSPCVCVCVCARAHACPLQAGQREGRAEEHSRCSKRWRGSQHGLRRLPAAGHESCDWLGPRLQILLAMLGLGLLTSLEWVSAPPLPSIHLPHVCPCIEQTENKGQGFRLSTTAAHSANSKKMLDQVLKRKITLKPTPGSRSCQRQEEVKKIREGRSCFHPKGFCQAWQMWMSILITCEGREMKNQGPR